MDRLLIACAVLLMFVAAETVVYPQRSALRLQYNVPLDPQPPDDGGGGGNDNGPTHNGGAGGSGVVIITAPIGTIASAMGCTHTTVSGYDVWKCSASDTWMPTLN